MSKPEPATISYSILESPAPKRSAWAKGTPQISSPGVSSNSQPEANSPPTSHSMDPRHPRSLGQGATMQPGVSVLRGGQAPFQGPPVKFGSVDGELPPVSLWPPGANPAVKTEEIESFRPVPALPHLTPPLDTPSNSVMPSIRLDIFGRSWPPFELASPPTQDRQPQLSPHRAESEGQYTTFAPVVCSPVNLQQNLNGSKYGPRVGMTTFPYPFYPGRPMEQPYQLQHYAQQPLPMNNQPQHQSRKAKGSSLRGKKGKQGIKRKVLVRQEEKKASERIRKKEMEKKEMEEKEYLRLEQEEQSRVQQEEELMDQLTDDEVAETGLDYSPQAEELEDIDGVYLETVDRKVKCLLNKLTASNFNSISENVIAWANRSANERNSKTLLRVIQQLFKSATKDVLLSGLYARLCCQMLKQISPQVRDDDVKNAEGKPIRGGQLFHKYLLNRCRKDLEYGLATPVTTAAQDVNITEKARSQGLGLIKFIAELFKLQMLTEEIMRACLQNLLEDADRPEGEGIEKLCVILQTVGASLDTKNACGQMDAYFARIQELTESSHVSPRFQLMLQDIIEFRERGWVPRKSVTVPSEKMALKFLQDIDRDYLELLDRKVVCLLNKLTTSNFDLVSEKIITWANRSENERDNRTLDRVIQLLFKSATKDVLLSGLFARLTRKIAQETSLWIKGDDIGDADDISMSGGQVFLNYLACRCQEELLRGWANHRAFKFMGELFKLELLDEAFMHECVEKLFGNGSEPDEKEVVSLCALLLTLGRKETNEAYAFLDLLFSRIKDLIKSPYMCSRLQFMLQDVIDLLERECFVRIPALVPAEFEVV